MPKILVFHPAAVDFIDNLPSKKLRAQVAKKVEALADHPYPVGCKKLIGIKDGADSVWRVRSGDYRILYTVGDSEINVLDIDNRKDVYR